MALPLDLWPVTPAGPRPASREREARPAAVAVPLLAAEALTEPAARVRGWAR